MTDVVCAVDVGTSTVKVVVYDADLRMVGAAQATSPTRREGAIAEVDLAALWRTVTQTVRRAVHKTRPDVLVFASQMGAVALLDVADGPIAPARTGLDRRHAPDAPEDPRTLVRLRHIAADEPALLERSVLLGGVKEVLIRWATGAWVTDPASASVTGLYDWVSGQWRVPEDLDLPQLPAIVGPAEPVGALLARAAKAFGLPASIQVLCGIGDGPAASLAAGAVGQDRACVSMGTTFVSRVLAPVADRGAVLDPGPPGFLQHVTDNWFCTGTRLTSFDRADVRRVALADILATSEVHELRATGGMASSPTLLQELADTTGLPVSSTGAGDGTLGLAQIARSPHDWLTAARDQPVLRTVQPRVGMAR